MADVVSNVVGQAQAYGLTAWKWVAFGGLALLLGAITFAVTYWIFNRRRYDFKVIIREIGLDGKPRIVGYDKGGVFLNKKTDYRLFLLRKARVGLAPDDIPYEEDIKGGRVVSVLRLGLKQFRYLQRPTLATNSPITMNYGVADTDVAWATNTIELAKQYEKKTILSQLLPFIGMAFVFLTVVVALYYLFVKAGFNADLIKYLADSANRLAQSLASANSGTTVVGG